ncbi:MAG TPA: MBL fold metallo-hydrolase [Gammaproteobacteria bacterium]
MSDGISVTILGDSGPFSKMGKSIGYLLEVAGKRLLVDCGSPLFVQIGGQGLHSIDQLIITHCHDDHKRWFTDLALFYKYAPDYAEPLPLMTTDDVLEELRRSAGPALDISLSFDAREVVDLAFDEFVGLTPIGPRARCRIVQHGDGAGGYRLGVVDEHGAEVGPERAKVVISRTSGRARLLCLDSDSGRWVEPASFYDFSDPRFYLPERRIYRDPAGFTIEPVNAASWHGLPTFGLRVSTGSETLVFSSDTRHDVELWEQLLEPRQPDRQGMDAQAFAAARVLYGDINAFIEQTWSEHRYHAALTNFDRAITIHDVAGRYSVVHTDYDRLPHTVLDPARTILTHSPDRMTSSWVLSNVGKTFRVTGDAFCEVVDGELQAMDADYYHKDEGRYYALYRNDQGRHCVYEESGMLGLADGACPEGARLLARVDVYEDVDGRYLPFNDQPQVCYRRREDGAVERVESHAQGSAGRVVADLRPQLASRGIRRGTG